MFTIFIILTIVPWNNLDSSKSPFVIIFEYIGIPYFRYFKYCYYFCFNICN
ncbi:hypothetical protein F1540_05080 [Haemophilus influenzae biotype aegyptius]|nr:hypothetical protein F1541_03250 [Haemophilus influenzae biotype aegyptius]QEQ60868.1 hypothetical protein F1540_05080 [Haemophilus influenzae biotype aegyptius]